VSLPFNLMRWFSLTAGFVRSFLATENAYALFHADDGDWDPSLGAVFSRILTMPDVLRVNVYSTRQVVI